jgi:hypothetical protein
VERVVGYSDVESRLLVFAHGGFLFRLAFVLRRIGQMDGTEGRFLSERDTYYMRISFTARQNIF